MLCLALSAAMLANRLSGRANRRAGESNSAMLPSSIVSTRSLSMMVLMRCAMVMIVHFANSCNSTYT